jgi:integrase
MAFTDMFVKNLKPKSKEYFVNEGRGFCIRVLPTGCVSFCYRYTLNGKRKLKAIGEYPAMSLADGRDAYGVMEKQVRQDIDPSTPPPTPPPAPEELTIQKMCEEYMEWSEKHHAAKWSYTIGKTIDKYITPTLGSRLLTDISRRDAIQILSDVPTPGAAKNVYKTIRSVFQYAVEREYISATPFTRLSKPVPSLISESRTRTLSPAELKVVWGHLNNTEGEYGTAEVKKAIMMILITAQRPGEVVGMHSDEIEEDWDGDGWWIIPKERTKNKKSEHMVYLSPMALQIIGGRKGYIFSMPDSTEPILRMALSHLVTKRTVNKEPYYGLPRWTPHDLRRTARTNFSRMGIPVPVAEAILNHAKEGMVKVYDLHEYKDEKKKAMLMWDKELRKLFG